MHKNCAPDMGPVATLESSELCGRDYLDCFDGSERALIAGTAHARRRQERLAGRLAAKYLFLEQSGTGALPAVTHLTAAHLDRFRPAEYRAVEVSRHDAVRSGSPRAGWAADGSGAGRNVAISHSQGCASACLADGAETISLDMERVEPRVPAFYRQTFTASESAWAASMVREVGVALPWAFTFLWTVKECLLKTPWFGDLSIADLPSMHVRITSGEEQLLCPFSARSFLTGFVFLETEITDRSRQVLARLAVSGRHDLVLTAVQRRIA